MSIIKRAKRLLNNNPVRAEFNKTFKNFTEKSYHEFYFRSMYWGRNHSFFRVQKLTLNFE